MIKKRVVFTFDQKSYDSMEKVKDRGHFSSLAETVRSSLNLNHALQSQVDQGFTEIVVRNPKTKEERVLVIPSIQPDI